jgi:hypothetical protein
MPKTDLKVLTKAKSTLHARKKDLKALSLTPQKET